MAVDGGREVPAVVHPANDRVAGWSSDGKQLLFISDRNGRPGLWSLPFENGKPQGKSSGKGNGKEELLDWVKGNNKMIQQQQEKNLNDLQNANPSNSSGFGGGDVFKKKAW